MSRRTILLTGIVIAALVAPIWHVLQTRADEEPHFIDPAAILVNKRNIHVGHLVYIAPFANLVAGPEASQAIHIGDETDVQDSVSIEAGKGPVRLGERVILAHNATVKGPAAIGEEGRCPTSEDCPAFVGFNAEVDGAILEKDTMVSTLARVGPGVRIPSGRKVLAGKNVASNDEIPSKTAPVTEADREFMHGVIEVNVAFAKGYATLAADDPSHVHGINFDPGHTAFNPIRDLPTLNGITTRDHTFRNRIIGDVRLADAISALSGVMGSHIAVRADEGEPFEIGGIACMASHTTLHALEGSHLRLGNNGCYGYHSVVHGGPTPFGDTTISGENFTLGAWSVFFRSRVGDGATIGFKSLVQESDLPAGAIVPPRTIIIGNEVFGSVEW